MNLVLVFAQSIHILFQHLECGVRVSFSMGQVEKAQEHAKNMLLSRTLDIGAHGGRDLKFIRSQMAKVSGAGLQATDISAIAHLLCHKDHAVLLVLSGGGSHHHRVSSLHSQISMQT